MAMRMATTHLTRHWACSARLAATCLIGWASIAPARSQTLTPEPGGTLRSTATKESIGDFVQLTGVSADRPVIDKTGLTGFIDYDILINQPEGRTQDDVNRAILAAIKDQLGMKLETAKDPIEMLVVERVEKPSEN
jgi:uncharacterized protein (TIGR03435 family)